MTMSSPPDQSRTLGSSTTVFSNSQNPPVMPSSAEEPPSPQLKIQSSRVSIDSEKLVLQTIRDDSLPLPVQALASEDGSSIGITMDAANEVQDPVIKKSGSKTRITINEHLQEISEICESLGTDVNESRPHLSQGLASHLATSRLASDGPNALTPPKKRPVIFKFLSELRRPLSVLLIIAGILSFILYAVDDDKEAINLWLGIILIVVTLINSFIEFMQMLKSEAILEGFKSLVPQQTITTRDGAVQNIPAADLVCGDFVLLKSGDKVPADVRIVSSNELKVDNSSLTGETDPLLRTPEIGDSNPLEAENIAFFGTLVVSGEGYGIVIRTGDSTVLGSIAGLAATSKKRASPLTLEIASFVMMIAVLATVLALVFFVAGMIIEPSFIANFKFLIGIFVANVPQGLPATVTMLLTFAAKRLATLNVLVKDLQAVDTLGSITLLASDKTGTITQNKMTVVNIWMNQKHFRALQEDSSFPTTLLTKEVKGHDRLIKLLALNRKAFFEKSPSNMEKPLAQRAILGDATESGILRFIADRCPEVDEFEKKHPRVYEIPFSSETKWALTINEDRHTNGELMLYIKGAPERVMSMCSSYVFEDEIKEMHEGFDDEFTEAYEQLANQGQRVLGLAYRPLPRSYTADSPFSADDKESFPRKGYVFIGLIGLMDPPKERVAKAVASCQTAGITVMMVTGDHPLTAEAIARQIGLIIGETKVQAAKRLGKDVDQVMEHEYRAVVVHGDHLDTMSNTAWDRVLDKREIVFARTSPRQKLEIVARCQAKGHVVGVTGDGVNDSPALKRADLGISMGISGSDVSKEAAAMILLDDNFTSIVEGIAQGRLIFTNLKKSIQYTLTHIFPEIFPFLLFVVVGVPLPLSAFLILMIDLGTELFSALSLAFEVEESNLMKEAPRRTVAPKDTPIIVSGEEVRALSRVRSFHIEEIDMDSRRRGSGVLNYLSSKFPRFKKAHPDDTTLVDSRLLFWCYMQAGIIEAVGALMNYFWVWSRGVRDPSGEWAYAVPSDLIYNRNFPENPQPGDPFVEHVKSQESFDILLRESNAAYFLTVVITQTFVLYAVKSQHGYPFGIKMFLNYWTYLGMATSLTFALALIHIPGLNEVVNAAPIGWESYLIAIGTGMLVVTYETTRRILLRCGLFGGVPGHQANVIEGIKKTLTREPYTRVKKKKAELKPT